MSVMGLARFVGSLLYIRDYGDVVFSGGGGHLIIIGSESKAGYSVANEAYVA